MPTLTRGAAMQRVTAYVKKNPGQSMWDVARSVGPNGSSRYGYAAIHRAARAGLVTIDPRPGVGRRRWYVVNPITPETP